MKSYNNSFNLVPSQFDPIEEFVMINSMFDLGIVPCIYVRNNIANSLNSLSDNERSRHKRSFRKVYRKARRWATRVATLSYRCDFDAGYGAAGSDPTATQEHNRRMLVIDYVWETMAIPTLRKMAENNKMT